MQNFKGLMGIGIGALLGGVQAQRKSLHPVRLCQPGFANRLLKVEMSPTISKRTRSRE